MARKIETLITATDKTGAAFNSVSSRLRGLRGAFAGVAAAFGSIKLGSIAGEALRGADELNKLSDRLGASVEALSEYQFVAEQTGVTFRDLTQGWQRLGRRVSQAARGEGEAKDALRELGLEAEKLTQLELDQQFEIIADALQNVTNATDRVRIAQKLFDSEGVRLLQTLKGGSSQIRELRQQYRDLGGTLDGEATDASTRLLDAWGRLESQAQALGRGLVLYLADPVADIVEWFGQQIPAVTETARKAFFILQRSIAETGSKITAGFAAVDRGIAKVARFFGADDLANRAEEFGKKWEQVSQNFANVATRIQKTEIDTAAIRTKALEAGASLQDVYNGKLQQQLELETQNRKARSEGITEQEKAEARRLESIESYIAALQREADTLGLNNAELIEYELNQLRASDAVKETALALQDEIDTFAAIAEVEQENARIFERSAELQKRGAKEVGTEWEKTGQTILDAFGDAVTGADSFSDALQQLGGQLLRLLTQQLTSGTAGSGLFGGLAGLIPGFAGGGTPPVGRPFLVGEQGPELLTLGRGASVANELKINVNVGGGNPFASSASSSQFAAKLGSVISRQLGRNR